jgi:hypothetical protein
MAAKNQLVRRGWTGSEFSPGQILSIEGWKGYRSRTNYFQVATLADGSTLRPPPLIVAR